MGQVDKELIWEMQPVGAIYGEHHNGMQSTRLKSSQECILVIDEDAAVRDITRDILERYGQNVLTAGSRAEALELCRKRCAEIAVVLLDVLVLESDGADLLHQMLRMNPAVKIIITSIYNNGGDFSRVLERGAAGFLKKPYRIVDLLRLVEQVNKIQ